MKFEPALFLLKLRPELPKAILKLALLSVLVPFGANAAVITFDDVINSQTSYSFDGDSDGISDVTFVTTDPGGFNTVGPGPNMNYIAEPGLEGTALLSEDLRVNFLNGAVGSLSFGFALSSGTTGPDVNTIFSVYDASDNLLATQTVLGLFTATPGGTSSFPEGQINVAFSGVAAYGTFDFNSGGRYIIDNFQGTFGSTEEITAAPEPSSMALMVLGGAAVVAIRRRRAA